MYQVLFVQGSHKATRVFCRFCGLCNRQLLLHASCIVP